MGYLNSNGNEGAKGKPGTLIKREEKKRRRIVCGVATEKGTG